VIGPNDLLYPSSATHFKIFYVFLIYFPKCPKFQQTNKLIFTYSMVQSPIEANWFAASQEIPRISQNPKVHYRTHKRPPPVSTLRQPNPVHIPTSHLLRPILILSTHLRLGLPSGLLPSGFPTKTYTTTKHQQLL